jgi:hypothetical protein
MNNKFIIAVATIVGMVIVTTLITYSNFNLPAAFGDHGEEFEDTYENWYEIEMIVVIIMNNKNKMDFLTNLINNSK